MKKIIAFSALVLFLGSVGSAMAQPFVYANVRVAPGVRLAVGTAPVVCAPVACAPAPVVCRPVVERRVVFYDRFHHRRIYDRAYRYGRF